jgi:hypothetical protein
MAKPVSFDGSVSSAYGKELETAVKFSGSYEKLDKTDIDSVKNSKEWPSDEDIVTGYINPRRLAAARAKATTEALDAAGIKKPAADDPAIVYRNLVKQMVLGDMSEDDAKAMAKKILGAKLDGLNLD